MDWLKLLPEEIKDNIVRSEIVPSRNLVTKLLLKDGEALYAKKLSTNERATLIELENTELVPKVLVTLPNKLSVLTGAKGKALTHDLLSLQLHNLISSLVRCHQFKLSTHQLNPLQLLTDVALESLPEKLQMSYKDALRKVKHPPLNTVLLHGDLVPSNVKCDKGRCWFIDWEFACIGDPHWDLAALTIELSLDQSETSQLLATYNGLSDKNVVLEPAKLEVWQKIYVIVCYAWAKSNSSEKPYGPDRYLKLLERLVK